MYKYMYKLYIHHIYIQLIKKLNTTYIYTYVYIPNERVCCMSVRLLFPLIYTRVYKSSYNLLSHVERCP